MAKISITEIHLQNTTSFIDELNYQEKMKAIGDRLTWEQMYAMEDKLYNLRIRQQRLIENLSVRLDQQMYNEIMGWELPNNLSI